MSSSPIQQRCSEEPPTLPRHQGPSPGAALQPPFWTWRPKPVGGHTTSTATPLTLQGQVHSPFAWSAPGHHPRLTTFLERPPDPLLHCAARCEGYITLAGRTGTPGGQVARHCAMPAWCTKEEKPIRRATCPPSPHPSPDGDRSSREVVPTPGHLAEAALSPSLRPPRLAMLPWMDLPGQSPVIALPACCLRALEPQMKASGKGRGDYVP